MIDVLLILVPSLKRRPEAANALVGARPSVGFLPRRKTITSLLPSLPASNSIYIWPCRWRTHVQRNVEASAEKQVLSNAAPRRADAQKAAGEIVMAHFNVAVTGAGSKCRRRKLRVLPALRWLCVQRTASTAVHTREKARWLLRPIDRPAPA